MKRARAHTPRASAGTERPAGGAASLPPGFGLGPRRRHGAEAADDLDLDVAAGLRVKKARGRRRGPADACVAPCPRARRRPSRGEARREEPEAARQRCVKIKVYGAFVLHRRVVIHAIGAHLQLDGVAMPVPHRRWSQHGRTRPPVDFTQVERMLTRAFNEIKGCFQEAFCPAQGVCETAGDAQSEAGGVCASSSRSTPGART